MQSISSSSSYKGRNSDTSVPMRMRNLENGFPNKSDQLSFAEAVFLSSSHSPQYDLGQSPSGPFSMSPPNLFMEKLQKRIDKYYSQNKKENSFSFTTRA